MRHGTISAYNDGCHCDLCRAENARRSAATRSSEGACSREGCHLPATHRRVMRRRGAALELSLCDEHDRLPAGTYRVEVKE